MAAKTIMEFKKGDHVNHQFKMPIDDYSEGGTLFFTAKPQPDNDASDDAAVIDVSFDDDDVTTDDDFATWDLAFEPGDISGVSFDGEGESEKKYLGEFQFVAADGKVSTFPDDNNFIEVIVYADIKRGTS